jgi:hypothetical protein
MAPKGDDAPVVCEKLARSSVALESAVEHARAAENEPLLAQSLRMLGATLGRRIQQCGELDLMDHCMSTLEQAISVSSGKQLVITCANLISIVIEVNQRGRSFPLDRAREALRIATHDRANDVESAISEYVKSLEWALDELEFLGAGAMDPINKLRRGELDASFVYERVSPAPR